MKRVMQYPLGFLSVSLLALGVGCGTNPSPSGALAPLQKSSVVVMKAAAKSRSTSAMSDIPVVGGSLKVQSAQINIERYRIEENSGVENEQQGQHEDNDSGGPGTEQEAPDLVVAGPFSFDISNGTTLIDSVVIYPGTFKKVDFTFSRSASAPFDGKAIVITGEFVPENGSVIPVALKSEFAQEIQSRVVGNGIVVNENTVLPVVVTFDLVGFFNGLDFGSARINGGQILLDPVNNASLLAAFEANLSRYVDVEEAQ